MEIPAAHPLLGKLHRALIQQVEESLDQFPPTEAQARAIAAEELRRPGGDRPEIWRALAKYVRKSVVLAALLSGCVPL